MAQEIPAALARAPRSPLLSSESAEGRSGEAQGSGLLCPQTWARLRCGSAAFPGTRGGAWQLKLLL